MRPIPGAEPIDLPRESFRRLRDEVLPLWSSPLLALDVEDLFHAESRRLYRETRQALERHYKFEKPWHSALATLFVFQAMVAGALPAVFYLIIKGRFGGGKTSLLNLLAKLAGGLVFENVSVAALARELQFGRLICIDEFDVRRPVDVQPVMDSVVRQGYRRNAAPYTRYDAAKRANEHLPIFGPKALTIRKFLDPALEDRGFIISASPVAGDEAYGFVVRNLWSDLGSLPTELGEWGREAQKLYPDTWLRERASEASFTRQVDSVVKAIGANRATELALIALLVSDIVGVDLVSELKEAAELRRVSIGTEDAADLEDLTEVILEAAAIVQKSLTGDATTARVTFRDLKTRVDAKRKVRSERPIDDGRLSTLLTELGVSESWKVRPKNRVAFDLPVGFVESLRGEGANPPNTPNPPAVEGGVGEVRPVSPPLPHDPVGPPQEELYLETTKADRLRKSIGEQGL